MALTDLDPRNEWIKPYERICPGCGCVGGFGSCHCDHDIYGPDCDPNYLDKMKRLSDGTHQA